MSEEKRRLEDLFEETKSYINNRLELAKLQALERSAALFGWVSSIAVIAVLFVLFILILSLGLALWISSMMGNVYTGFFIIAGVFLLAILIIYSFKNTLIKNPVADMFIRMILKKDEEDGRD